MVVLGLDGLKEHVKTIGLYNTNAKNVIALLQMLVANFGGEVPADREELVRLPGGRPVPFQEEDTGTHLGCSHGARARSCAKIIQLREISQGVG